MKHIVDNRVNIYSPDEILESIQPPVVSKNDVNYIHDLTYMKRKIKKTTFRKTLKTGTIIAILLGLAVTAVLFLKHRIPLQEELDDILSECVISAQIDNGLQSAAIEKKAYAAATKNEVHDLLLDELEDGNCLTAVICPCCNEVLREAQYCHNEEDDDNCTTAVVCNNPGCTVTLVEAKKHTAKKDDGNCMTEVACKECGTPAIPAKSHRWEDDGMLTTKVVCLDCGMLLASPMISFMDYLIEGAYMAAYGAIVAIATIILFIIIGKIKANVKAKKYEKDKRTAEDYNYKHFNGVRSRLLNNRQKIVCESMATISNGRSKTELEFEGGRSGRIFLTEQALEYYDMDVTSAYKNFVIPLNSILRVNDVTEVRDNEITVNSTIGNYTFVVPDATGKIWRSQIITACEHRKYIGVNSFKERGERRKAPDTAKDGEGDVTPTQNA